MIYHVTYSIDARYTTVVEADNIEEAKKQADYDLSRALFGDAEDISTEMCSIEDDDGNLCE